MSARSRTRERTAILVGAGCAAALAIWGLATGAEPPAGPPPLGSIGGAGTVTVATAEPADAAQAARVIAGATAAEPWLAHDFEAALEVRVLDELGLPVEGYRPLLAPVGGSLQAAPGATGVDGKVVVRWPTRRAATAIELHDPRGHRHLLALEHGRMTVATLLRARAPAGGTLGESPARREPQAMTIGLHPAARFAQPLTALGEASARSDHEVTATVDSRLHVDEIVGRFVGGIVVDADNAPAPNVPVLLLAANGEVTSRTHSDEAGHFRFDAPPPGSWRLRAGGDWQGLATSDFDLDVGVGAHTTLQLWRGDCVRGTLRDRHGTPVPDATLEWRAADGAWADRTESDGDGAFVLANLPPGPGALIVWAPGGFTRMPAAYLRNVVPNAPSLTVLVPPDAAGLLQVRVVDADGRKAQATVRARHVESGIGHELLPPDDYEDVWQLAGLAAGLYDVLASCAGVGEVALARQWLDGGSRVDLGTVTLPAPCALRMVGGGNFATEEQLELIALRPDFDVRVEPLQAPGAALLLPAGRYALAIRRSSSMSFVRFDARSGEAVTVPLPE